ncbi:hypothetical protein TNCV_59671 [Trichonephila clavipes]|nr:hypothetical protein TNCV_59671 [Trichonephila clavipes]
MITRLPNRASLDYDKQRENSFITLIQPIGWKVYSKEVLGCGCVCLVVMVMDTWATRDNFDAVATGDLPCRGAHAR